MPNVKFLKSMNVLMLFKQIVGRMFNADNIFPEICCCMYGKKSKLHHEGDT